MRIDPILEKGRWLSGAYGSPPLADYGAFEIDGPCGARLKIIASSGDANDAVPWDHVSVSTANRCPNWTEMCFVKDLFWEPEETVMQLHPPRSKWVNNHSYCLHLWKPTLQGIPLPPSFAV